MKIANPNQMKRVGSIVFVVVGNDFTCLFFRQQSSGGAGESTSPIELIAPQLGATGVINPASDLLGTLFLGKRTMLP